MDSVLITGLSGTIGTALGENLLDRDIDVTGIDLRPNPWNDDLSDCTIVGDVRDMETMSGLPTNVDVVVHLAAHSRVRDSVDDPSLAAENLEITADALEFARKHDLPFLFSSSREVYGNLTDHPCSEDMARISDPANPYGASKTGGEALVHAYRRCYDIDAAVLRFTNVYGRYDLSSRVIPTFVRRALDDKEIVVYGSEKTLDFVFIDDVTRATGKAMRAIHDISGHALNIGSGSGTRLVDLADRIVAEASSESSVTCDKNRPGEVETFVANITTARKLLDYSPRCSIDNGVRKTLDWHRQHDV